LSPTLQIKKKKEKDLYPTPQPSKNKKNGLVFTPHKQEWTTHSLIIIIFNKNKTCTYPPIFKRINKIKIYPYPHPPSIKKNLIWK
jgi:hypothetical protein